MSAPEPKKRSNVSAEGRRAGSKVRVRKSSQITSTKKLETPKMSKGGIADADKSKGSTKSQPGVKKSTETPSKTGTPQADEKDFDETQWERARWGELYSTERIELEEMATAVTLATVDTTQEASAPLDLTQKSSKTRKLRWLEWERRPVRCTPPRRKDSYTDPQPYTRPESSILTEPVQKIVIPKKSNYRPGNMCIMICAYCVQLAIISTVFVMGYFINRDPSIEIINDFILTAVTMVLIVFAIIISIFIEIFLYCCWRKSGKTAEIKNGPYRITAHVFKILLACIAFVLLFEVLRLREQFKGLVYPFLAFFISLVAELHLQFFLAKDK